MSIQICLLRSGETVIADIKEALDPEKNESVGYFVSNPFIIDHKYETVVALDDEVVENPENKSSLEFKRWGPLARRYEFNFPSEFITVIYEPAPILCETYVSLIQQWQEDNTVSVECDKSRTNVSLMSKEMQDLAASDSFNTVVNQGDDN